MEPGDSMPHSQGFSNNPILSRVNPIPRIDTYFLRSILISPSHLRLGHPKGIFPVGVPVKILRALLPSSILATWPAYLNLLDLITLTILAEPYTLWSSSLWSHLHSPLVSFQIVSFTKLICYRNVSVSCGTYCEWILYVSMSIQMRLRWI